jgi:hypothetical protein
MVQGQGEKERIYSVILLGKKNNLVLKERKKSKKSN